VAVPPAGAGTTTDTHYPAGFGIAHSLFHQLIIVSTGSVLRRGAPGLPRSFHLCQLQLLITQALHRTLDTKSKETAQFTTITDTGPVMSGYFSEILATLEHLRKFCRVTVIGEPQTYTEGPTPA
jgi:hypothetical protein